MHTNNSDIDPSYLDSFIERNGQKFGQYTLYKKIGFGGMGAVYFCQRHDEGGGAVPIALKLIHPHLARQASYRSMFRDEAQIHARVRHRNVCRVVDFGEIRGVPFLAMEWLPGETMSAVLCRSQISGTLPAWLSLRIVADAARGLHAVHELRGAGGGTLNVVHRDVSPTNIQVLYAGGVQVFDFGVAQLPGGALDAAAPHAIKGNLRYMAPEQARGDEVDRRADVWALGVILWEASTGKRLFQGSNVLAVLQNLSEDRIPPLRECAEGAPEGLQEILDRTLSRDPEGRYATAAELAEALERCLGALEGPRESSDVSRWMQSTFRPEWEEAQWMHCLARYGVSEPEPRPRAEPSEEVTRPESVAAQVGPPRVGPPRLGPPSLARRASGQSPGLLLLEAIARAVRAALRRVFRSHERDAPRPRSARPQRSNAKGARGAPISAGGDHEWPPLPTDRRETRRP